MAGDEEGGGGPLSSVGGWLAGGYATVTGLLTYLGIQGDALTRMMREEQRAMLFFGALMALGIILGLVVQKVDIPGSLPVWLLLAVAACAVFAFPWAADLAREVDVVDANLKAVYGVCAVTVFVVFVTTGAFRLSTNGVLLVLGGLAFALGSYGGVRLATSAKAAFSSPQIEKAQVTVPENGPAVLDVSASVEGIRDCQELVVVATSPGVASDDDGRVVLGSASATASGKASVSTQIPLAAIVGMAGGDPKHVDVTARLVTEADCFAGRDPEIARARRIVLREVYLPSESPAPVISATLSDKGSAALSVKGTDLVGDEMWVVASTGTEGACKILASASSPISGGVVELAIPLPAQTAVTIVDVAASTDGDAPACAAGADAGSSLQITLPAP